MANGASTISSPQSDTRTFSHTGSEVGSSNVTLTQNTTGQLSKVLEWTMPKKYTQVTYAGGKHRTQAALRTLEQFGSHSSQTVSLTADIQAIAGETQIDEQPYPVAVVYDTTAGSEVAIDDVDYATNTLTLNSADYTSGNDLKVWPVLNEGSVQYRAIDQFNHVVGPLDEWGTPYHVFNDFNQEKNMTQIHLVGAGQFKRDETLALYVDSPRQVVWTDSDYPRGAYVSRWEQRVDVRV